MDARELLAFVAGGRLPSERYLVFVCYLDDSDDDQSRVSTLAGYVARVSAWERYEEHASLVYQRYKVGEIASAKELHNGHGPFKGWPLAKKWQFVDDLFNGFDLFGIGHSVDKISFAKMKASGWSGIGPNMSKLGIAMAGTMHALLRGNVYSGYIQHHKLSFVVETGHRNNGNIEKYFHIAKSNALYADHLGGIQFWGKKDFKALHLADFLAFYLRRHHALSVAHGEHLIVPQTKWLTKLTEKCPHILNVMNFDNATIYADAKAGDSFWLPVSSSLSGDS